MVNCQSRRRFLFVAIGSATLLAASAAGAAEEPADPPTPLPVAAVERQPSREIKGKQFRLKIDGADQVLGFDMPEEGVFDASQSEPPLRPTLEGMASAEFVSASLLIQKAKQFDDGLYAAVDLAAQSGLGDMPGKELLLSRLAAQLKRAGVPQATIVAAARLAGAKLAVGKSLDTAAQSATRSFLADESRSKPIGFYTWSKPLRAVFQQDRLLQSELTGKADIEELVKAIHSDAEIERAYRRYLTLVARLTNPLAKPDLRQQLDGLAAGKLQTPAGGLYFFPPSVSHETELVKRMFANRPIPAGFQLIDELVKRIRNGQIDLTPGERSGWYDHQTWSFEPLVIPERMPERERLSLSEPYRKHLLEIFKGVMTLTRETHIKQLEVPAPAAAPEGDSPAEPKEIFYVGPELSLEPLATAYYRRARSYQFVRGVLAEAFGAESLGELYRQTATGPVGTDLATELDQIQSLFSGAYALASQQLGLVIDESVCPQGSEAAIAALRQWRQDLTHDADLTQDARAMVPVFYDRMRRKTKVWLFLGWSDHAATVYFARPPAVTVLDNDDRVVTKNLPDVVFTSNYHRLPFPVSAEVYVSKLLDRDEFRALCDKYQKRSEILKQLK